MDARSAPFQSSSGSSGSNNNTRDPTSPTATFGIPSSSSSSSPPKVSDNYAPPALAAPRAVPPYPRFTSPQPQDVTGRSPSPSKRAGGTAFSFGNAPGDARERWASLGQAQQTFAAQPSMHGMPPQQQQQQQQQNMISTAADRQRKMMPPPIGPFHNESFPGYNDIWNSGPHRTSERPAAPPTTHEQTASGQGHRSYTISSSHPPDLEHLNTRFDPSNMAGFAREEGPFSAGTGMVNGMTSRSMGNEEGQRMPPFHNLPGIPASGSLSPRSLLHYHQQQIQAQQAMAVQAAQHNGPTSSSQSNQGVMSSAPSTEEITTVFIVGFPDDMTEREFANMFLFAKGFEASTLKIPSGSSGSAGPGLRTGDGSGGLAGPGGPYNAVNMPPGSGLFDLASNGPPGGWDEHSISMALSRAGTGEAGFPAIGGLPGTLQGLGNANNAAGAVGGPGAGPGGKIKQIIGFAKFRTRAEALEARDALNGRKIDAERGCVLKTEMAKKNLHTKQRPILANSSAAEGSYGQSSHFAPLPAGGPGAGAAAGSSGAPSGPSNPSDREVNRSRQEGQGPPPPPPHYGMGQPSGPAGPNFESFPPSGNAASTMAQANGLISPSADSAFARGPDFFRTRMQEGSQGSDPGRGSSGEGNKWAPLGPLDFYDGPQQQPQMGGSSSQSQQSHLMSGQNALQSGGNVPRGPDWSAFGSPPGLYSSNRGNDAGSFGKSSGGGVGGGSSTGALSPYGEQPGQSQQQPPQPPPPQQQQQPLQQQHQGTATSANGGKEDSGRGESTVRETSTKPLQSPPLHGSENNEGPAMMTTTTTTTTSNSTRPQSRVSTRSRQGSRTTSPVNVTTSTFVQRFGSLRIDSPSLNQPRPYSPNPRSPSGENVSIHSHQQHKLTSSNNNGNHNSSSSTNNNGNGNSNNHNHDNSSSTHRATSPTSPFLDPSSPNALSSPTSRSFSIDTNPPGNTLFVGNLPGSITVPPASTQLEDALRRIFSQKKGFRQMSFRVKSSGPMCFVEFEDVGCAGRALGEANGDTLDGTVKGGLRLSFSKNPLFKSTLPDNSSASTTTNTTTSTSNNAANANVNVNVNANSGAPMDLCPRDLLDLDQLSDLEGISFHQGFADGETHGNLHGLFEGRHLGTLKGFEVWQEIGHMRGVASFWLAVLRSRSQPASGIRRQERQIQQLETLIGMIADVPRRNGEEVNLFGLLDKLRAKYRMVCSSLDIPASTVIQSISQAPSQRSSGGEDHQTTTDPIRVVTIHGRSVDSTQLDF